MSEGVNSNDLLRVLPRKLAMDNPSISLNLFFLTIRFFLAKRHMRCLILAGLLSEG